MELQEQTLYQKEDEINLGDIFKVLLNRIWVLLLCLVIGAGVGLAYTAVFYTYQPVYTATVSMFLNTEEDSGSTGGTAGESSDATINDNVISQHLLRQSVKQLDSDLFREELKTKLGTNLSSKILSGGLYDIYTMEQREESVPSGIVEIGAGEMVITYKYYIQYSSFDAVISGGSEQEVYNVAKELIDSIPSFLSARFNQNIVLTRLNNINVGYYNPGENVKTYIRNTAIFAAAALLVAAIVVVVLHLTDTRIKDSEEITKQIGVPVLGVIPRFPEPAQAKTNETEGNN